MKEKCFLTTQKALFLSIALLAITQSGYSTTLKDVLPGLLKRNDALHAAEYDLVAAEHGITSATADWMPTLDVTLNGGYESQDKPTPPNTYMHYDEESLKLSQLIYDFGATQAAIETAKITQKISENTITTVRQSILLQGTRAYLNLVRAYVGLQYARLSEDSIKKQVEMEKARVKSGSGFSTDVLEAQAQLAQARSRVVAGEGDLNNAKNTYRAIFRIPPDNPASLEMPAPPMHLLPKSLDEALRIARTNNLSLKSNRYTVENAHQAIHTSLSSFTPEINFTGELKHQHNVGGTAGSKGVTLTKVELTYPLFAGFSNYAGLKSSQAKLSAAERRLDDLSYTVDEQIRNTWDAYLTSKATAVYIDQQAAMLKEFLEKARKERKLGRRSLVDVLVSEVNYINALSAGVASKTTHITAAFQLLQSIGKLELAAFSGQKTYALNPTSGKETSKTTPVKTGMTTHEPSLKVEVLQNTKPTGTETTKPIALPLAKPATPEPTKPVAVEPTKPVAQPIAKPATLEPISPKATPPAESSPKQNPPTSKLDKKGSFSWFSKLSPHKTDATVAQSTTAQSEKNHITFLRPNTSTVVTKKSQPLTTEKSITTQAPAEKSHITFIRPNASTIAIAKPQATPQAKTIATKEPLEKNHITFLKSKLSPKTLLEKTKTATLPLPERQTAKVGVASPGTTVDLDHLTFLKPKPRETKKTVTERVTLVRQKSPAS